MAGDQEDMLGNPTMGASNPKYLNVISNLVSAVKGEVADADADKVLKEAFAILGEEKWRSDQTAMGAVNAQSLKHTPIQPKAQKPIYFQKPNKARQEQYREFLAQGAEDNRSRNHHKTLKRRRQRERARMRNASGLNDSHVASPYQQTLADEVKIKVEIKEETELPSIATGPVTLTTPASRSLQPQTIYLASAAGSPSNTRVASRVPEVSTYAPRTTSCGLEDSTYAPRVMPSGPPGQVSTYVRERAAPRSFIDHNIEGVFYGTPYLIVPNIQVTKQGITDMAAFLKPYHWKTIRADRKAYYILFEPDEEHKREALRLQKENEGREFMGMKIKFTPRFMELEESDSDWN